MKEKTETSSMRPPIVVVLGHVDHGKTTLLDKIRSSSVATREAGGITQSIGASVVKTKSGKITFIDTPGHAVFNEMRSRGAKLADIAILVVASDDGVKPQTKEAIKYIKETKIACIVAATKSDLPSANMDKVKASLAEAELLVEGYGGNIPIISVSGKNGEGIDELLEMLTLISEIEELTGDSKAELDGVVLESVKDKRGSLISAVIKNGSISVGDIVKSGDKSCKVKALFDSQLNQIKSVGPGEPTQILGFNDLPRSGERIHSSVKLEKTEYVIKNDNIAVGENEIPIVIKAKTAGSLEAVVSHIPKGIVVVSSSVGDVTESDIFVAKSAGAKIFTFESKIPSSVKKLSNTEGVKFETFDIVYKLFERLESFVKEQDLEVLGKAEIIAEFPFNKQRVAGSKVKEGRITKSDIVILVRGEKEVGESRIGTLKKERKDVDTVKMGEEFGLMFKPYLDFKVGDVILSVRK